MKSIVLLALFATIGFRANAQTTVYVWLLETCPISKAYMPVLKEMASDTSVKFIAVFPNILSDSASISSFFKDYNWFPSFVIDRDSSLRNAQSAKVTPQVMVFSGSKMVYRGRIDNRYAKLGRRRETPTEEELKTVLLKLKNGQFVEFFETTAIGCLI